MSEEPRGLAHLILWAIAVEGSGCVRWRKTVDRWGVGRGRGEFRGIGLGRVRNP